MSSGQLGKTTTHPRDIAGVQTRTEKETTWGELTGTVVSFNPDNQTASVQPDYKPTHNGERVSMPTLEEVPVRFPRAGGFVLTVPVKAGDRVSLRPQMRSSEDFHGGGDYSQDKDARSMSLSDMEAFLDGGEPLSSPVDSFNSSNMELRTEDGRFKFEMSDDGRFRIVGVQGDWFAMISELLDLLVSDTLVISHGSSAGSNHSLSNVAGYQALSEKFKGMQL